ncbi:MAG: fumarylacetoacetate hydrolase family protein [Bacteroidales bacterium]|nr:fumarylacetoacetate hydrolase family protein [Bacteroidales bacterium]
MKILCIGRNYRDHISEMKSALPTKPVFFLKADSCILNRNRPFFIPPFSSDIHYEAEIVLRIAKVGKCIETRFAHRYYDAIALGIDFTARDIQADCKKNGLPWTEAKSFDGSACMSGFYPLSDFGDIHRLDFSLYKNDIPVQKGNTADMIFGFDEIISHVSHYMTLKTGDYIYTGTPSGVGNVNIGDRLRGYLGNKSEPVLDMKIK